MCEAVKTSSPNFWIEGGMQTECKFSVDERAPWSMKVIRVLRAKIKYFSWDVRYACFPIFSRDVGTTIRLVGLLDSSGRSWINRKLECRGGITFLRWCVNVSMLSMLPSSKQIEGIGIVMADSLVPSSAWIICLKVSEVRSCMEGLHSKTKFSLWTCCWSNSNSEPQWLHCFCVHHINFIRLWIRIEEYRSNSIYKLKKSSWSIELKITMSTSTSRSRHQQRVNKSEILQSRRWDSSRD